MATNQQLALIAELVLAHDRDIGAPRAQAELCILIDGAPLKAALPGWRGENENETTTIIESRMVESSIVQLVGTVAGITATRTAEVTKYHKEAPGVEQRVRVTRKDKSDKGFFLSFQSDKGFLLVFLFQWISLLFP